MGKRTGRKRGAPYGNTNRLTHGKRSAEAIARRRLRAADARDGQLLHDAAFLLGRVDHMQTMLLRIAKAFAREREFKDQAIVESAAAPTR
jgi:hypothetical protein